ncbi:MAG TPA: type II CAAX endopeptidase family protein [Armatimonadota bacterium]|jgi:membrane protease YdiL (CAAX protease family)
MAEPFPDMVDPSHTPAEPARPRPAWELALLYAAVAAWIAVWYGINSSTQEGTVGITPSSLASSKFLDVIGLSFAALTPPLLVGGLVLWVGLLNAPNRLPPLRTTTALLLNGAVAALLIYQLPSFAAGLIRGRVRVDSLGLFVLTSLVGGVLAYAWAQLVLGARGDGLRGLGWNVRSAIVRAVAGYVAMFPLVLGAFLITALGLMAFPHVQNPANPAAEWATKAKPGQVPFIYIVACVIAPIVEELVFRGFVFRGLEKRYGVFVGALASAMIFAGMHPQMPFGFPPLVAFAFAMCYVYRASGSLVPGMLIHAANNALVLTIARLAMGGH